MDALGQRVDDGLGFFEAHLFGEGRVGEPFVCEVRERVRPAEACGGLPVEELFEGVCVAFAPLSLQVARWGVFALPQRGEEFVEVHSGVPFLLRCWLISSIGESPTLARSRWAKEEALPARGVQTRLLLYKVNIWCYSAGLLTRVYSCFFSSHESGS